MTAVAIDADAVNCIRTFGLLAAAKQGVEGLPLLVCTGYVAHHELNPIADEIAEWQQNGVMRIEHVLSRSPASKRRKELQQEHRGIDKGEAEMLAWILACSPTTPFASCDRRALGIARSEGIRAWDVLDLVHEWLARGVLSLPGAMACLVQWDDDPKARWRPRDFQGVEPTLRSRYGSEYLQPLAARIEQR